MTKGRKHNFAFTLLELVLVMVVLCVALAAVAPSLRGWSRGQALRDAADQFVALTHRARTIAITEARTCRIDIDVSGGTYQLTLAPDETQTGARSQNNSTSTDTFTSPAASWARPVVVPRGVSINLEKATIALPTRAMSTPTNTNTVPPTSIEFSPVGATDPATVTFTSDDGSRVVVQATSPAGGFAIVQTGGRS